MNSISILRSLVLLISIKLALIGSVSYAKEPITLSEIIRYLEEAAVTNEHFVPGTTTVFFKREPHSRGLSLGPAFYGTFPVYLEDHVRTEITRVSRVLRAWTPTAPKDQLSFKFVFGGTDEVESLLGQPVFHPNAEIERYDNTEFFEDAIINICALINSRGFGTIGVTTIFIRKDASAMEALHCANRGILYGFGLMNSVSSEFESSLVPITAGRDPTDGLSDLDLAAVYTSTFGLGDTQAHESARILLDQRKLPGFYQRMGGDIKVVRK